MSVGRPGDEKIPKSWRLDLLIKYNRSLFLSSESLSFSLVSSSGHDVLGSKLWNTLREGVNGAGVLMNSRLYCTGRVLNEGGITPRPSKKFLRRTKHNHTKFFRLERARGWVLCAFHCRQIQKLAKLCTRSVAKKLVVSPIISWIISWIIKWII